MLRRLKNARHFESFWKPLAMKRTPFGAATAMARASCDIRMDCGRRVLCHKGGVIRGGNDNVTSRGHQLGEVSSLMVKDFSRAKAS